MQPKKSNKAYLFKGIDGFKPFVMGPHVDTVFVPQLFGPVQKETTQPNGYIGLGFPCVYINNICLHLSNVQNLSDIPVYWLVHRDPILLAIEICNPYITG